MDMYWMRTSGWAKTRYASSRVIYPATVEDVQNVLRRARQQGFSVVPRGAGHSYTDAMLNDKGIVIDLSRMRHVLAWDPERGIIRVEPGVTIDDLWRAAVADGWWPAAHPSVLRVTVGGSISMNAHGTNAWNSGSIGEHVLAFELLLASGERISVTPSSNPDLFYAAIGGMGMLGVMTSITLQLRPVSSGMVMVRQLRARTLSEMFAIFAEQAPEAGYLEGWIDTHATCHHLGRGLVRRGDFINESDPSSLEVGRQRLAANVAGILPPTVFGRLIRPIFRDMTVRLGGSAIYQSAALPGRDRVRRLPLAEFNFHNDAIYRALEAMFPLGGHGFQPCVPAGDARAVFRELLERSQCAGILPFWCWFKQHRADPFLLTYQVDGFSLDLAYRVTRQNALHLPRLLKEMREAVISSGGRLYLAKDSAYDAPSFKRSMGRDPIERFLAIKDAYDPMGTFQSDLFRRVFADREHWREAQSDL